MACQKLDRPHNNNTYRNGEGHHCYSAHYAFLWLFIVVCFVDKLLRGMLVCCFVLCWSLDCVVDCYVDIVMSIVACGYI